ncbi:MAG: hypothetical protein P8O86_07875 [Actinomycetota bacterium]|nr:hypothetical protein [Actinomycetota bacterium]MDG2121715.1 hypothetical protein [Actinomycetota bacterium]
MARDYYDSSGEILSLRNRKPIVYWTSVLVVFAMFMAGFSALASLL